MESVFLKRAIPAHACHDVALPRPRRGLMGRKGEFGGEKESLGGVKGCLGV